MRRGLLTLCLLLCAPPAAQAQERYWSLLGVGQGETVNAAEFGRLHGVRLDRFFKPASRARATPPAAR